MSGQSNRFGAFRNKMLWHWGGITPDEIAEFGVAVSDVGYPEVGSIVRHHYRAAVGAILSGLPAADIPAGLFNIVDTLDRWEAGDDTEIDVKRDIEKWRQSR